ncbi:hypothetical protein CLAM6_34520 [Cobetia sp. AM6]|nr:hypothetical protein CLAM6_34520 [Cobetia sp. AM6]
MNHFLRMAKDIACDLLFRAAEILHPAPQVVEDGMAHGTLLADFMGMPELTSSPQGCRLHRQAIVTILSSEL